MSSPTSSSSTHLPRTPLHERSDSDNKKLQIRVVPYSPPRPDSAAESSHVSASEVGKDGGHDTITDDPTRRNWTTDFAQDKDGQVSPESVGSPLPSSPASPIATLVRVKGKGKDVSESRQAPGLSGAEQSAPQTPTINRSSHDSSNIRRINAPSQVPEDEATSAWKRSRSRRDNFINVHSDKTFSIVLKPTRNRFSDATGSSLRSSLTSPPLSYISTLSSHEGTGTSFDAATEDQPVSPLSPITERGVTPETPGSYNILPELIEDPIASSPSNYRMVGGLRKVADTPDLKNKGKEREIDTTPELPPLPREPEPTVEPSLSLVTKTSFSSQETSSTIEETTNYKVIGRSSPPLADSDSIDIPPSSSSSNVQLLGHSSPAQILASEHRVLDTPGSRNFVVHPGTSPASSFATFARQPRRHSSSDSLEREAQERDSQESLIIPPLRPQINFSSERLRAYKNHSRESLQGRADSFSSISSVISEGSSAVPNVVRLHNTPSSSSIPQSSWAGPSSVGPHRARMDQHQWSSQLSTVPSEYEGSQPSSRIVSSGSMPDRGSSALGSRQSWQLRSISSSIAENLEPTRSLSRSHSRSGSLDRPSPAYMRGARERELPSPPQTTVKDHDEDGDGLADLRQLNQLQSKTSRSRLGFLSRQSSNQSMRSTSGSMTSTSLPAWARLYYGSGERRWLQTPSIISEGGDSRPASSWAASGSPSNDHFTPNIHNPRRRAREIHQGGDRPESMQVTGIDDIRRGPRRMTSSIWSPHLRLDHRASRYSVWNPPSVTWSAESGIFGRRNVQVVLFVVGFAIPFAWMIAAFLPLPPKPMLEMEQDHSTTQFHIPEEPDHLGRHIADVDDSRYQSARWWRNLNRFMSIIGLLILGAVAALAVTGVQQNWAGS